MTEQWNTAEGQAPEGHGGGLDIGALVSAVTQLQKQVTDLTGALVGGVASTAGQAVAGVGGVVADVPGVAPIGTAVTDVGAAVAGVGQAVQAVSGGTTSTQITAAPTAEAGSTTSEFKLAVGSICALLGMFGVSVSTHVQGEILTWGSGGIALLGAAYTIGRSWRKRGTPA